jgi:hypothetical protein
VLAAALPDAVDYVTPEAEVPDDETVKNRLEPISALVMQCRSDAAVEAVADSLGIYDVASTTGSGSV